MSEQLKINNRGKVYNRRTCNLIQAEIYSYTPDLSNKVRTSTPLSYYELRTRQTEDGTVEELVETAYPITADYVRSFADMADYTKDVESARNAQAKGSNLGDITAIQDMQSIDSSAIEELRVKLDEAIAKIESQTNTKTEEKKDGEE